MFTPRAHTVTVRVDGPVATSANNNCSSLTQSDMNCRFNITEDGEYTVTLSITNEIGTTSKEIPFDCKFFQWAIHTFTR